MNADEIKTLLLCYWRFERGCEIVSTEFNYGASDVISVNLNEMSIYETEVKVSVADMKRECRKSKHRRTPTKRVTNYFYFAVPDVMKEAALSLCKEFFPYAGLLVVRDYEEYLKANEKPYVAPPISEVKRAQSFGLQPVDQKTIFWLARGMSNTLCSKAYQLMRLRRQHS